MTCANLNLDGKMLSDIEKLAKYDTSSEKTEEQDFMRRWG